MKPILFVKFPYSSSYGGGEHHTLVLCEELRRQGVTFSFLGSCSVLLKEFRRRGLGAQRFFAGKEPVAWWSVVLFPFSAPFVFLALTVLVAYYRLARGTRTLYCLSLTEKLLLPPVARLLGMRVVWVEHVEIHPWLAENPFRFLYRWWSRFVTIVAISRAIEEQLTAMGIPKERIVVIYNGVDLRPYPDVQRKMAHWTKRFVVGTVARLEPEKGIAFLLHAFQKLLLLVPHARLMVVGDGTERRRLEWLAKRLAIDRQVQWVGFQQHIPEWIQSFDCFVLPSVRRESFGIVLLEAMAATCPVIASNLGGIPEIVANNRTGILVEPGDAELLMQAMLFIYRHPDIALRLGLAGRARVEEHFTRDRMLAAFLRLLASP